MYEIVKADDEGNMTWERQDLDMIRKWATAAESLIHGRASGLDAAVCTYGESPPGPSLPVRMPALLSVKASQPADL